MEYSGPSVTRTAFSAPIFVRKETRADTERKTSLKTTIPLLLLLYCHSFLHPFFARPRIVVFEIEYITTRDRHAPRARTTDSL